MLHIGLVCPSASGHLHPMTTLGHALASRGHRVTLIGPLDSEPMTLAAGLEFWPIGETALPAGSAAQMLATLGELSGSEAFRYTIDLFKQVTSVRLNELPEACRQTGVEFLLIDQTAFGASSVAERLGLPFVSVCCALLLNREPDIPPFNTGWSYAPSIWSRLRNRLSYQLIDRLAKPITAVVNDYRQRENLPRLDYLRQAFSPLAQICQQPIEFEFPRRSLPPHFHFTGPFNNLESRQSVEFPFDQLSEQPLIYASMGTVQNRLFETFEAIAQACANLDAQLVIALGGGSTPEAMPPLAGNPIVVGYAPQLELLKRATLTITHAGLNTALESLSYGVPMVAIPVANDQPGVASRVAWTKTGTVVPLKKVSAPVLKTAIEQVLGEAQYKQNALKLQKAIQAADGINRAADIVETVIATGAPVLADS